MDGQREDGEEGEDQAKVLAKGKETYKSSGGEDSIAGESGGCPARVARRRKFRFIGFPAADGWKAGDGTGMSNLSEARIGCVRYLNSKPLIHGHGGEVSFEVPASLADGLHSGRLDVALSPIFELMAHPGYLVVDGVAIASRGAVFSVFVAYAGELRDMLMF